jgi:hypothetical protein
MIYFEKVTFSFDSLCCGIDQEMCGMNHPYFFMKLSAITFVQYDETGTKIS